MIVIDFWQRNKIKYRSNKKKPLKFHCNGFQYIHIQRLFYFQLQQKLQYAGIVGKIKIYDNTNRDFMVIGLFI